MTFEVELNFLRSRIQHRMLKEWWKSMKMKEVEFDIFVTEIQGSSYYSVLLKIVIGPHHVIYRDKITLHLFILQWISNRKLHVFIFNWKSMEKHTQNSAFQYNQFFQNTSVRGSINLIILLPEWTSLVFIFNSVENSKNSIMQEFFAILFILGSI